VVDWIGVLIKLKEKHNANKMYKLNLAVVTLIAIFFIGAINAESCIVCTSERDRNCAVNPGAIPPRDCGSTATDVNCYTRIVGGLTLRGCSNELDQHVLNNCTLENNCDRCSGVNNNPACNDKIFPQHRLACHQCSGNLTSSCSGQILENPLTCATYESEDSCYIHRTASNIERGCLSSSGSSCNERRNCYICVGHGCNSWNHTHPEIPLAPNSAAIQKASVIVPLGIMFIISLFAF